MVIGTAQRDPGRHDLAHQSRLHSWKQVQGIGFQPSSLPTTRNGRRAAPSPTPTILRWPTSSLSAANFTSDIVAATGVMSNFDRILIGGKEQDVKVIGTDQDYSGGAQHHHQLRPLSGRKRRPRCATKTVLLTDLLAAPPCSADAEAALSQG